MTNGMPEMSQGVVLAVIDIQERLVAAMPEFEPAAKNAVVKLLKCAGVLKLETLVTEQYPQGLGPTIPDVAAALPAGAKTFSKTAFSCFGSAEFAAAVDATRPAFLLLAGMETHVCVQQTALDALARGIQPVLLADAVTSRKTSDRETALRLLRHAGVTVTTVEAVIFHLLRDAKAPGFKEISRIFREA